VRVCLTHIGYAVKLAILCTALPGCVAQHFKESVEELHAQYVAASEPLPRVGETEVVVELLGAFQHENCCYVWIRTNAGQPSSAAIVASSLIGGRHSRVTNWSAELLDGTEVEVGPAVDPYLPSTLLTYQPAYPSRVKLTSSAWSSVVLVKIPGTNKRVSHLRPLATQANLNGGVISLRFTPTRVSVEQR